MPTPDLTTTVHRIIVEEGMSALPTHHLPDLTQETRTDVLLAVLDHLSTEVADRVVRAGGTAPSPKDLITAVLAQLLPMDDQRTKETLVGNAFLAEAAHNERIAEELRTAYQGGHEFLTGQLSAAGAATPDQAATILIALVDGLTAQVLAGQITSQAAAAAVDATLHLVI